MADSDLSQSTWATTLATAKGHHQQGDLDGAWRLYEALRAEAPDHPDLLHLTSLILLRRGAFAQAVERIQRAKRVVPDSPILWYNEGLAWMHQACWEAAESAFREAIRLKPTYVNALCQLSRVLIHQKKRWEVLALLEKAARLEPERAEIHALLAIAMHDLGMRVAAHYRRRLANHYGHNRPDNAPPQHTFFMDPARAVQMARQGNLLQETIQATGLQVCYYAGEPVPDAPPNLIPVPVDPEEAEKFFCLTTLTLPVEIDFDPTIPSERLAGSQFAALMNRVAVARGREIERLVQRCRETRPVFVPGQPLRVYLPASRHSDVPMYHARDLAEGFRKQGCEVLYYVESNKMETFDYHHWLQAQVTFNPHITVDINNRFDFGSQFSFQSHPDLFRMIWVQDPSPPIMAGNPLPWRARDLVYASNAEWEPHLYRCGVQRVRRQHFCYEEDIFKDFGLQREREIVLVASSHTFIFGQFPGCEPLLARMEAMFEAGEPITEADLDQFAAQYPYSRADIFLFLWAYVVRNVSARWLCELSNEIPVVVYGHRWADNPVVSPFYKGILPHGPAVAEVYNRARYVFVPTHAPHSQRLVEAAACGAIPIAYDCRYRSEPPYWDDQCLWYRTKADLRACLTQTPQLPPVTLCQGRRYEDFAKNILQAVHQQLAEEGG